MYVKLHSKINTCTKNLVQVAKIYTQILQVSYKCLAVHSALQSTLGKPKLFCKKNRKDSCMNMYIKGLVSAWSAKHDMQYALDTCCCVMYICNYMTKIQKGTGTLIAEACKEAKDGNMTLKQNVHHMANKFLIYHIMICYNGQ